jgi:lambda family phage portal protein
VAKAKQKSMRADLALPEELALRRYEAQTKLMVARQARKAMLATYKGADRGRANRDWRVTTGSADLAIIQDAAVLNARARQITRDTWMGKSIAKAVKRLVVGRGVKVVPFVRDANGKADREANRQLSNAFNKWARNKKLCDVEKRQNLVRKQGMIAFELPTVGEHFIVWSYTPNSAGVGLQFQSFEPEQLYTLIRSYEYAPGCHNEVKGGIEIDRNSAPVAYHFYTRNPLDIGIISPKQYYPVRIPADRVWHVFDPERTQQTRGVTWFAPVLQDIRDFGKADGAVLMRFLMEACIGMIVKKTSPTGAGGNPFGTTNRAGDSGQTLSGLRTMDFVPGMVPELAPGEDVEPFIPTTPGNTYEPYTNMKIRTSAAGVGLSFDQVARRADDNYSAARQNYLQDQRECDPITQLIIDDFLAELYPLFVRFAVLEGRIPAIKPSDYLRDPDRFNEALYVPDPHPWIDPEKEMNAVEKKIENRLSSRSEEIANIGGQFETTIDRIQADREYANARGITMPEDVEAHTEVVKAQAEATKADAETTKAGAAVKKTNQAQRVQLSQADAPSYHITTNPVVNCRTCGFLKRGECTKFNFKPDVNGVCDEWQAMPPTAGVPSSIRPQPPSSGENPPVDVGGGFEPAARNQ